MPCTEKSTHLSEQFLHLNLRAFIHLDEWRPGAFETFAGEFLRRVNAELVTDGAFVELIP